MAVLNSSPVTHFSGTPRPNSELADLLGKARRRLRVLTGLVGLGLALTGLHESFVLFASSVPFPHHIVHISLVVIGICTSAGLWVFWDPTVPWMPIRGLS